MRVLFHCPWHNNKEWLETIKKQFKNNKIYTLKDKPDLSEIECAIIWNISNYTLSRIAGNRNVCKGMIDHDTIHTL